MPEAKEKIEQEINPLIGFAESLIRKAEESSEDRLVRGLITLKEYYEIILMKLNNTERADTAIKRKAGYLTKKRLEAYDKYCSQDKWDQEVLRLFRSLREEGMERGFTFCSSTNTEREIYELNKRRGLFDLFDRDFVSVEMGLKKPNVDYFREIIRQLSANPKEILFIDDKKENIKAANGVGMSTILYSGRLELVNKLKAYGVYA